METAARKGNQVFNDTATEQTFAFPLRRHRIWEINRGWHCSLIGTCLTLSDLRSLARKLSLRNDGADDLDYRLHGHFVREAGEGGKAAKLLTKLLDHRHAGAVRRFQRLTTTDEVAAAWQECFKSGDIPGPFWAALSHPHTTTELGTRIYSDVHMLSHLVGASNRADLSVLRQMEMDMAELEDRLEKSNRRHSQRMDEKDHLIDTLQQQVSTLSVALKKAEAATQQRPPSVEVPSDSAYSPAHALEIDRMKRQMEDVTAQNAELNRVNKVLAQSVHALESEVTALEQSLSPDVTDATDAADATGASCPFDLNGRCILYVGGRAPNVCRLRDLVTRWNGELVHHDGGLEKSLEELSSAVIKADAVVFPTDCVSHQAMHKVKRLCRKSMKPYVPLRSSGVAAFVAGLRGGIPDTGQTTPKPHH